MCLSTHEVNASRDDSPRATERITCSCSSTDATNCKPQHRFHGRVSDALVAVYEGMVLNEEVPERRSLLFNRWIQFVAIENLQRLQDGGFETAVVTNTERAARLLHDSPMKFDDLGNGQVKHYESRR